LPAPKREEFDHERLRFCLPKAAVMPRNVPVSRPVTATVSINQMLSRDRGSSRALNDINAGYRVAYRISA
jgi:hypothetical protein